MITWSAVKDVRLWIGPYTDVTGPGAPAATDAVRVSIRTTGETIGHGAPRNNRFCACRGQESPDKNRSQTSHRGVESWSPVDHGHDRSRSPAPSEGDWSHRKGHNRIKGDRGGSTHLLEFERLAAADDGSSIQRSGR
ncbi:LOW QUALITY PROTEIN: hypothetical protein PoB_004830900 [Plakobranchus ocellatus]|uniref:Uncharacterized protein n=1 Tax=Plakobranchus ocellatus TaxID=259542 RepID=A0AAV4BSK4_9GAST|nr:LOW QUALITY PROTEIN: hypothetical protein PoB_004830900 [Plakobranchus ocellatus]